MTDVSIRTCAGCGRKAPQQELVRFAGRDGVLTPEPSGFGRGVYTCRRLSCFERARERRAFARTLRQTVRVDPALSALYTGGRADG
ncbi:MAG: YlxR family protein [Actinomycetota bacterium]|nr:YlxR family protein [Actinomycetota bacterium]